MTDPYPLVFEPILMEKVWGGRRLEALGKRLRPGVMVGESWEIADLAGTSPTGGGGGQARSRIARGSLAGRTLHDAMALWGGALARATPEGAFPLLVKFLDARENLSVQVHPSAAYAAAHPWAHLKAESWVVLDAAPGSVIYKGLRAGVTREAFERALRAGAGEGVVELLERVPAREGECHTLPSGTLHALGAGVLVAEAQTPSDTTFRVYDWVREYQRPARALHVEEALACIDFTPAPGVARATPGAARSPLADTPFFQIEVRSGPSCAGLASGRAAVVIATRGAARAQAAALDEVLLARGGVALVPAALASDTLIETDGEALVLTLPA